MMDIYPPELQSWINDHGGLTPHMIFLKGPELATMVPACSEADVETAHALAQRHRRSGHTVVARGPRFHHYYARPPVPMF
jgi:hypothetical protein